MAGGRQGRNVRVMCPNGTHPSLWLRQILDSIVTGKVALATAGVNGTNVLSSPGLS